MDDASRAARWLLGATAHPGGVALSRHLLDLLTVRGLAAGALVVDVACGRGGTLDLLAGRGLLSVGVDLAPSHPRAVVGNAEALPLRSGVWDAVVCECSVSTFAHPVQALAEAARVLRPGGLLAMTDVVLHRDLAGPQVVAAIDRLTSARTLPGYAALLAAAGFDLLVTEDRRSDALTLVRRIRRRLPWSPTVRRCEQAVLTGSLSYGLLVGRLR